MQDIYLGKVCFAKPHFSRLWPLASLGNGGWVLIENPVAEFPKEGKVFCLSPDLSNALPGEIWTFFIRPNPRPESGSDQFLADEPQRAVPIIDLSTYTVETARKKLFESGVVLSTTVSGPVVVLLTDDQYCLVNISRDGHTGLWRAIPSAELLPVYSTPTAWKNLQQIEGCMYVPARSVSKSELVRRVDWSSDADFVEHILKRFKKLSLHFSDTDYELPAKSAIAFITRAMREADLLPSGQEDIAQLRERLQAQWPQIEAKISDADGFREMILGSRPAKTAIDRAVIHAASNTAENLRIDLEPKIRREIEDQLEDLCEELKLQQGERMQLTGQLEEIRQKKESAETEYLTRLNLLSELQAKLNTEVARLQDGLRGISAQELPYARTVVERLEAALADVKPLGVHLFPASLPPWGSGRQSLKATNSVSLNDLKGRLHEEAEADGIEPSDLVTIDAFARAGELVLLLGSEADAAVAAYSRCVSAGDIRDQMPDPSVIGLDDLWRTPGSQLPTAFAHAWTLATSTPEMTVLVCLRGLDAAPFHLWLAGFNSVLRSASRPRNLLVLATASCWPDTSESEHPFLAELRNRIVPVLPRASSNAGLRALKRLSSATFRPETLLNVSGNPNQLPSLKGLMLAVAEKSSANTSAVSRAAYLACAAEVTCGTDEANRLAAAWFSSLESTSDYDGLPPPLRHGYAGLGRVNFHR